MWLYPVHPVDPVRKIKLHLLGFYSIRLVAFQASGSAHMKHSSDGTRISVTIDDYDHNNQRRKLRFFNYWWIPTSDSVF